MTNPVPTDDERKGKLSASSFDADFSCWGRHNYCQEKGLVSLPSQSATRGERIHQALEKSDLSGLSKSEAKTAEILMDMEAALVAKMEMEGATQLREQRFWVKDIFNEDMWSARLDVVYYNPDTHEALIIDYKTGPGDVVSISANYQMMAQAVSFSRHYPCVKATVAILQPMSKKNPPTSTCEYTIDEMNQNAEVIEQNINKVYETHVRTPSPVACAYCPAKKECPEREGVVRPTGTFFCQPSATCTG